MGTDGADFTDGEIDFSSGRRIAIHPYLWLERFKQYRSRSRAKALASLRDAFRVASVTGGGASLDWLDRRLRICEPSGFKKALNPRLFFLVETDAFGLEDGEDAAEDFVGVAADDFV